MHCLSSDCNQLIIVVLVAEQNTLTAYYWFSYNMQHMLFTFPPYFIPGGDNYGYGIS